jgi:hypothetical protein
MAVSVSIKGPHGHRTATNGIPVPPTSVRNSARQRRLHVQQQRTQHQHCTGTSGPVTSAHQHRHQHQVGVASASVHQRLAVSVMSE